MIRFVDWLHTKAGEKTAIGDLARDSMRDPNNHCDVESLSELIESVPTFSANVMYTLREAWARYAHEVSLDQTFVYGFLYKYDDGVAYIKFGFSDDPWSRLRSFNSASPVTGRIVFLAHGDRRCEQAIHRALRPYRTEREWYRWRTPIGMAIAMLGERFIDKGIVVAADIEWMLTPNNLEYEA